ncbi:xanthine dehydrogenase family protein molybdopterin-binding subunit [Alloyangia pacifica]|uniref:Xanthine dehydrogenase YagR molybdenum-binding subunit n=1 Tax=Alloyangia pacifica TaxID=311180 RepID=A0A1I6QSN9_9RHOB|nr:xanthine dehydrogenase family protein molybdopterin-binding subunit [Alloyangia pacifica]SDF97546.1 xanthine dehydrogenase YagR molybdenum-binding subunit [Alloyangia pacifica]SFS55443.1 xanthine dehydrogenase YagR molybdenum-binding subunit [Alloyangia pacifica]
MDDLMNMQGQGHVRLGSSAGQALTRRDGILKVTGAATYAADNRPDGLLHAVLATAGIAKGRVTHLDVAAAEAHPGVVKVYTPQTAPRLAVSPDEKIHPFVWRMETLTDDSVRYAGQPIALVLAETLEAATEGARLLAPRYETEAHGVTLDDAEPFETDTTAFGRPAGHSSGDVDAARATAARHVSTTVETSQQYHNAIEPHAITARWEGDRLEIDTPNQAIGLSKQTFAAFLGIDPSQIVLRSPFLGGGFGSKAILYGGQMLAILSARDLGRPVKLVLRRDQMYGPVGHRAPTRQALQIDLDAEGNIAALEHDTVTLTSTFDQFLESASNASHSLYAAPNLRTSHRGRRADVGTPGPMRAPGEAPGSAALEIAMDAAAQAAGMDPLEFRLKNYAESDPSTGMAFSSKGLRECYAEAAKLFGWAERSAAPRSMRQGRLLKGWGMGTAQFPCPMFQAAAHATLRADGSAVIETSAADMGQGAWTALAQIAADGLGIDIDKVEFRSGHSDLPDAGVAGGSGHTATAGTALFNAGADAVRQLAELATNDPASPLFGAGNAGVTARSGRLYRNDDERSEAYEDILARAGLELVRGEGTGAREGEPDRAMFSHGAVFAEVLVDPDLGQVRVSRLIGAFAAGRIVNPRLARSQLLGGMIWGIGMALQEEAVHDTRSGRLTNADLAGYHVPVNADVPMIEALTVHEDDPFVNALGIKGVGEIGVTGTVGAIGNAVWHATGVQPTRFPIHPESLI